MEPESLNIIQKFLSNDIVNVVTAVVALAAAITMLTPSKVDNVWLQKIVQLLNLLGLNIGKAKNADDA